MRLRLRYKNVALMLMFFYPLADIAYNTFTDKSHYSTFSIAYFLIYLIFTMLGERYLLTAKLIIAGIFGVFYGLLYYTKSGSILIQLFLFLIMLCFFSNQRYLEQINNFRKTHMRALQRIVTAYALMLLYSIIFAGGIHFNWNTFVLYGPYELPHTLAYEVMVLIMIALLNYKDSKQKKTWLAFAIFFELMIILTCVRSAFLSSAIVFLAFVAWFGLKKRVYLMVLAATVAGVFAYFGAFDQIIEKTFFAVHNGSITNGREWLVDSALQIFGESSISEKIFGSGYLNLLQGNARILITASAVQAHNDLFTVLVTFGLMGFALYVGAFIAYVKGKHGFFCFTALFVLLYFNGLFLYMPMVIGLGIARVFFAAEGTDIYRRRQIGLEKRVNQNV